jgi:hypothetical protein
MIETKPLFNLKNSASMIRDFVFILLVTLTFRLFMNGRLDDLLATLARVFG